MSQGWIKLHRAIEENPRFRDSKWLQIWIKCLILATHRAFKTVFDGKVIELQPGQFITSRKSLARETDTHESRVERILKTLEIEQQIEQAGGASSRLITVTKWADYQGTEQDTEQRPNSQRTPSEHLANTNKNGKKGRRGEEEKENPAPLSDLLTPPDSIAATRDTLKAAVACALLEDPDFSVAWSAFLQMRKDIKFPAGFLAQERLLKKLEAYPAPVAAKMVDESTMNSWRGVFPLREKNNGSQNGLGGGRSGGYESASQRNLRKLRANLGLDKPQGNSSTPTDIVLPVLSAGTAGGGNA